MVYGICLAHNGPNPLYNPWVPSLSMIFLIAGISWVGKVPGFEVYILTLVASQGQRNISAITSAEAEETAYPSTL